MYFLPSYQPFNYYMMRQIDAASSYVRVLHASPDAPGVDVYANGNLIARNLKYRRFTPYLKVPPGTYNIKVFPAGTAAVPVIDTNVTLAPDSIYTAAAVGRLSDIELMPILDPKITIPSGKANIRFVHLSPDAPAVDITLPDGKILFSNVGFKGISDYLPVASGTYTLQARAAGTDNVVLTVPNIVIRPGVNYTVYAVGLAKGTPGLQVLIPMDGSTYLQA